MGYEQQQKQSHWESRVESLTAINQVLLAKKINESYEGKFIVGTQIFQHENLWTAFVYYKVKD